MTTLSPCARCHEACCRDYLVTVSGLDVHRISTGLGLAPRQFVVPTSFGDPPDGFRVDDSAQTYRLALDKRRTGEAVGWCTFWLPFAGGLGRCGIYALRPGVCRTYPATLRDGEVGLRDNIMCPDDAWTATSELFTASWRRRAEQQYAELEVDAYVNRRWNRTAQLNSDPQDGFGRYLDWMLKIYDRTGPVVEGNRPSRELLSQVLKQIELVTPL
ncbi:MAG: YkgJ family cysteine cluster protein [Microlunatus sp.]